MNDPNIDKQLREAEEILRSPGTRGKFAEYLDNQLYTISLKTKAKYLQILRQFQDQDQPIIPFLRGRRSLAALGAIKKVLLCIGYRELSRDSVFKSKRLPVERQALHTTIAEREQVIECIANKKYQLVAKIQHDTGCRAAEAVGLTKAQIMAGPDGRVKLHLKTKGSKTRDCFLSKAASSELDEYIESIPVDQNELFYSKHAITCWTEYNYYWKALRKAAVQVFGTERIKHARFGTHGFRFGLAEDILKKTGDIMNVKKVLGHANISTSAIYAEGAALSSLEAVKQLREGCNGEDIQVPLFREGNAEEREIRDNSREPV